MDKIKYKVDEYVDEHSDRWFEIIDVDANIVVFKEKDISKEFVISIAHHWNRLNEKINNKEL